MPIGNATWGDFTCDSQAEMLANSMAVIGTTCLRTDYGALPGTLFECIALPPTSVSNWAPISAGSTNIVAEPGIIYAWDPIYGGTWTGLVDDSVALQAALNEAKTFTPRKNVMLPPLVGLSRSVAQPKDMKILGFGYVYGQINTTIKVLADAVYDCNGFAIGCNTADGVNLIEPVTGPGPGWKSGVYGVFFDNLLYKVPDVGFITYGIQMPSFVDLRSWWAHQMLRKIPTVYNDNLIIENIQCNGVSDYTKYAIEIGGGGGDCMRIINCNFPTGSTTLEMVLAIFVYQGSNGFISNIINGTISLKNVRTFEVSKHHAEEGQLLTEDSDVRITDCGWQVPTAMNYIPVISSVSAGNAQNYTLVFESCRWIQGQAGLSDAHILAELKVSNRYNVEFVGCRRELMIAGEHAAIGIRIVDASDVPYPKWADNAGYLSMCGRLIQGTPHGSDAASIPANDILGLFNALSKVAGASTFINNQVLFYRSQFLIDAPALLGRNGTSAELTTTCSATNAANERIYAPINYGTSSAVGILRLYRGGATNSYDKYCDIPVIGARGMADEGDFVMGLPWKPRTTGPMDTLQVAAGSWVITPQGRQQVSTIQTIVSAAAPSVNCVLGSIILLTASNATVTFAAPTNVPPAGDEVTFIITQDATGGRTIAWNTAYVFATAWSNTGNTAGKVSSITFLSDGIKLVAQNVNVWY